MGIPLVIHAGTKVLDVEVISDDSIKVVTNGDEFLFSHVVVASGYSFSKDNEAKPGNYIIIYLFFKHKTKLNSYY